MTHSRAVCPSPWHDNIADRFTRLDESAQQIGARYGLSVTEVYEIVVWCSNPHVIPPPHEYELWLNALAPS